MTPNPPDWMGPELYKMAQAVSPGSRPIGDPYKAIAFKEDDKTDWQVNLEPGACYTIVGVADQTSEELRVLVWDPEGDEVMDEEESPARVVGKYCVQKPGLHKIRGIVTEGHGHYHVAVFVDGAPGSAPRPAPADPGEPGDPGEPQPAAKPTNLEAVITAKAKAEATGATLVGDFFTGTADKTDWYTALEPDKCYWFIGAGDKGVSELHLYLWDPEDKRITANKGPENRVSVGHCPKVGGMFHFQAKVERGAGTYKVGVYARKK